MERWLDHYLAAVDQPELGERIDLFQRLLDVHNVVYLLLGLRQHGSEASDNELRTAMPFMQSALSAALDRAAAALALSNTTNHEAVVADFVDWLLHATPATC
jgi:hypothetical protein